MSLSYTFGFLSSSSSHFYLFYKITLNSIHLQNILIGKRVDFFFLPCNDSNVNCLGTFIVAAKTKKIYLINELNFNFFLTRPRLT